MNERRSPMTARDEQRERTRQRLFECALMVFRRDGVDACRIEEIATAAGVSRASFYFHFPTKEHVLLDRMRQTEDVVCDAIDALPQSATIAEVLSVMNTQIAAVWGPDPSLLPEVCGTALRRAATAMSDQEATRIRACLLGRFRVGVGRGEVRPRLPPDVLSDLYLSHTLAALLAWYGNRSLSLPTTLNAVTDLFWNGARG